jgi:prefoldin subunit 5
MTLDQLHQRMRELELQAENIRASLYQVVGAIADCQWWIDKLQEQGHASQAQQDGQGVQSERRD